MKVRLVKETLADGRIRYCVEALNPTNMRWDYITGSVTGDFDEARAFYNRCVANESGPTVEVIEESP